MNEIVRNLDIEAEAARALLLNLRAVLADDEQAQTDAIEGETNLHEAITEAVERLTEIETYEAAISMRQRALAERKSRLENQGESIRSALQSAMGAAGIKKLELAEATLTIKATPPKVIVTEEADVPAEFWEPQPPKLDKKALLKALKEHAVSGAMLSNGGHTIQIKRS